MRQLLDPKKGLTLPAWAVDLKEQMEAKSCELAMSPNCWERFLLREDQVDQHTTYKDQPTSDKAPKKVAKKRKNKSDDQVDAGGDADQQKSHKFEDEHFDAFVAAGFNYPPEMPADFAESVDIYTRRMQELIYYMLITQGPAQDLFGSLVFRDLNMSMKYGSAFLDRLPCLVSTSLIWCRGTYKRGDDSCSIDRMLTGEECLAFQGWDHDRQRRTTDSNFSFTQKVDLAGNAFAVPVIMTLLHCVLFVAPTNAFASFPLQGASPQTKAPP